MRNVTGYMVLVLVTVAAARADAESATAERARELFLQGADRFVEEDYEGALEAFEASYAMNAVPSVLYNIAQCHRALFHHIEAIETFERYLQIAGDRIEAGRRAEVEGLLEELEARVGRMILELEPAGASAELDGRPVPTGLQGGFRVLTGRHSLRVWAPGYREQIVQVDVSLDEPARVHVALEPEDAAVDRAAVAPPTGEPTTGEPTTGEPTTGGPTTVPVPISRRWWLWTIVGVAVAAGVGVGLGIGLQPRLGEGDFEVSLP